MLIETALRQKEEQIEGAVQFIDSQLEELRDALVTSQAALVAGRIKGEVPFATASHDSLLQAQYRSLDEKRSEAVLQRNLERRQLGETFMLVDGARDGHRVGSAPYQRTGSAAVGGLVLGFTFVLLSYLVALGKSKHPDAPEHLTA
jgi:hypothetical protein